MINWVAQQIKMALCKHTLNMIARMRTYSDWGDINKDIPVSIVETYHCAKCGFKQHIKL